MIYLKKEINMEEWKEYKLGELYDVHNGLTKGGKFFGSGYPFLSFSTVFKNYFLPQELTNLVQSSEKEQSNFSINKGDVFITRTSESADELGMSSVALKDYPNATYNGFTKRLRPKGVVEIYPKYIGYYLRSPKFRYNFYGITSSMSTRASLSNGDLLNMIVILPPYATQQKIANILSSLDDKIEVNRRINEQLEELAGALFKSWFVDFAPFKDGEFVDSELVKLGSVINTTSGGTPSRKHMEYYSGNHGWVKSKELNGTFIIDTEETITDDAIAKSSAKLLPEKSILIAMYGATVGQYAVLSKPMTCNQAVCALLPNDDYPYTFLFMFAKNKKDELINKAVGSAQQNISQILIKDLDISNDTKKIKEYHKIVGPAFEIILKNQQEIHHLTTLRDTLLPKLISGEIDVNEVEI